MGGPGACARPTREGSCGKKEKAAVVSIRLAAASAVIVALTASCNPERKQECERFLAAMSPLDDGTPSTETVNRVSKEVEALNLQDQPLHIYAENYGKTLTVLATTLELQSGTSAPDGTDDVVKSQLRMARTDAKDVARYCSQ
jgi:hypothetical protein